MNKDHAQEHEANRQAERSARSTRRELLKAGGLLAAAGASAGLATQAAAQAAPAPPFETMVTPQYFPLGSFTPELSLAGKVAVITGASRGIGLATGLALQAQGVTVIGTSLANGLAPSFVGDTYVQLLQMHNPLPNVVTGSRVEPYASQCLSATIEQGLLADNAESAMPFGAAGAPVTR